MMKRYARVVSETERRRILADGKIPFSQTTWWMYAAGSTVFLFDLSATPAGYPLQVAEAKRDICPEQMWVFEFDAALEVSRDRSGNWPGSVVVKHEVLVSEMTNTRWTMPDPSQSDQVTSFAQNGRRNLRLDAPQHR